MNVVLAGRGREINLVHRGQQLQRAPAFSIVQWRNVAQPLLEVTVGRVDGKGFTELGCGSGNVTRLRQMVAPLQMAAHNLLAQGLLRAQVFDVAGEQLGRVGDGQQGLIHLPGFLQHQGPFELLLCRLPVSLGNAGLRFLRSGADHADKKNQDGGARPHRKNQFYLGYRTIVSRIFACYYANS